jgi:hypothetical protein
MCLQHFPNQPAVILLLRAGVRFALLAVRFPVRARAEEFGRELDTNDLLSERCQSRAFHDAPLHFEDQMLVRRNVAERLQDILNRHGIHGLETLQVLVGKRLVQFLFAREDF